jgi:hypothetical protein
MTLSLPVACLQQSLTTFKWNVGNELTAPSGAGVNIGGTRMGTTRHARSQMHILPSDSSAIRAFRTGVSLHGHTEHFIERLADLSGLLERIPIVAQFLQLEPSVWDWHWHNEGAMRLTNACAG